MKKAVMLLVTFSFALAIGFGVTLTTAPDAEACICDFPWELIPTCETGPNCTNPSYPYYMYKQSMVCPGCYQFSHCYNGMLGDCI